VPGALLALIAERSTRESLQDVIGRQLAREAGHTADRLSAVLRTERETLENFAKQDLMREIRVDDIDKRVSMALMTLHEGNPVRLHYLVVDPGRRVVAAGDPARIGTVPPWTNARWSVPYGAEPLLGPLPTDAARSSSETAPNLLMTTPIYDPDDRRRFLGTLVGLFDWEQVTRVTENVRRDLAAQGIEAEVLVTRADGALIGGSRLPALGDDAPRQADLAEVAADIEGTSPDYTVDADAGLIIGRASLAPDLPDWKLLVVEAREDALAPARRSSRRLALAMGIALIAAFALATLAARRVVRPLTELTRAIRGLSQGDASARTVPVRSEDEVGALASAFNKMASELDQAHRELVEAEKFAFVGELAAGVAHEIRTALNVLGSSAQILERSLHEDSGPQTAELAQMIREEVGRLAGIVNDLLTLSRARPLALEARSLSEPLSRARDFVAAQAQEKQMKIVHTAPPEEPILLFDSELIYQVAVNLAVNAIQVLGHGGCIELRVLEARDGYGGFEVRDDGPGVPDELRERIFEPFVTAREGGVGLGLTFVKRVVHDHRGSVSLESGPNSGACFRIQLPLPEGDQ
jgi:signal transduction histidine kinase